MKRNKKSPNKFVNALFGRAQLRREQEVANQDFEQQYEDYFGGKIENPYAGVKNPYENLQNVYEDATVNLTQAKFAKEQSQQAMANIMSSMQGAAGGSGVAGLAQVLANQGVKQAQEASISIGAQEQANQQKAIAESGRLAQQKAEGEQQRDLLERKGRQLVEQDALQRQQAEMDFALQRKEAADQRLDDANAQFDKFISGAVTTGLNMALPGAGSMMGAVTGGGQ
jgi:ethanolamine utilization protein EutQ (cupin superfamily)